MKRLFLALVFLAVFAVNAMAQFSVKGTVKDEASGKAMPYVSVALVRTADTVLITGIASDDKGTFELKDIAAGAYEIRAVAMGYETYKQSIEVNGNMDLGVLNMKEGDIRLEEVQIFAKRPLFMVEGEKTFYNVAEDPSIQMGTASDALQNAPGVAVDVEGNVTLRGTSSVDIWINDKPSHLNAENLKTYLQQLPANSIDHVEVITNPSARYGSQADGIINIVTNAKIQKNQFFSFGVNGSTRPFALPWASYVWANEKWSVNLYANGSYAHNYGSTETTQSIFSDALLPSANIIDTTDFDNHSLSGGVALNVEYNIDSLNSLQVWGGYWPTRISPQTLNGKTHREELLFQQGVYDYSTEYKSNSNYNFYYAGAYYKHGFGKEGHDISLSFNVNGNKTKSDISSVREYLLPNFPARYKKETTESGSPSYYGEVVYNLPYSEAGTLSFGASSQYQQGLTTYVCDTLANDVYVTDAVRSYEYTTKLWDNEAFVTLEQKIGGFTVKPGLRFEQYLTSIDYNNISGYDLDKHYYHMLPSLHLSYSTKSMHNFKASYTRRVSDPNAEQLSLFVKYDEDDFSSGNDELNSIFTNSFEAGWTKYWMKFGYVGLSAYYKGKSNDINTISEAAYDDLYGRFVMFTRPVNVGKVYNAGAELNLVYRPSAMFNLRFYGNLYNSHLETHYDKMDDENITKVDMWSYSLSVNMWTKLWNKLEVHCTAYYSSPTQTLFAEKQARYSVNCGVRADFFDRKMSVFLNGTDIFNWNKFGSSSSNPFYLSSYTSHYNSRCVSLGVTFRFGKMELERKARQGGEDKSIPTE